MIAKIANLYFPLKILYPTAILLGGVAIIRPVWIERFVMKLPFVYWAAVTLGILSQLFVFMALAWGGLPIGLTAWAYIMAGGASIWAQSRQCQRVHFSIAFLSAWSSLFILAFLLQFFLPKALNPPVP